MMKLGVKDRVTLGLSIVLLVGATVDMWVVGRPLDAGRYHANVRQVVTELPTRIDTWMVEADSGLAADAAKMLRPNVTINRHFINMSNGQRVSFLLVQCGDARDLNFHYPPICYANQGFRQITQTPKIWKVGDMELNGMEYQFAKSSLAGGEICYVSDTMLLPGGRSTASMEELMAHAADLKKRFYGAAHIQFVFRDDVPEAERDKIVETLMGGNKAILEAIGGVKNEK